MVQSNKELMMGNEIIDVDDVDAAAAVCELKHAKMWQGNRTQRELKGERLTTCNYESITNQATHNRCDGVGAVRATPLTKTELINCPRSQ